MKKILLLTILLGACLLTFLGCAKDELDTTGSIAGVITDAETSKALSGATVTLSPTGKSFTTGVDGRYEFRDIAIGNYTVQATKAGYAQNQKSVEVMAGETSSLDLPLRSSAPKLEVSTQTLDFGNSTTTLTLDIRNTGAAELTWQVSEDIQWLSCVPTSGSTSPDKTSSVIVNVDRNGLSRGTYQQTIAISSNGGSAVVNVTLSVQGLSVSVSPEELDFGSTNSSLQLTLTNTGSQTVSYTLTPSNNWIKPSKTQGVFSYSDNLTVAVDRTGFSEGDYKGSLSLIVGDQSIEIPVRMNIPSKAKPTVSLLSIDDVTYNTAVLRGSVVSIGSATVTHHGFCWSTQEEPTTANAQKCDLGDLQTPRDFNYSPANLEPNTTYYVRAYAENAEGISYSNQMKMETKGTPQKPTVETSSITGITDSQAQASGNILKVGNDAGITQYGHVWSTRANPTTDDQKTQLGSTKQTGTFSSTLTGLSPNQTYHVRAYAINAIGTAYGEDVTFTTTTGQVSLTTDGVNDITHNAATCSATVSKMGGNVITERGVCWSTTSNPTINAQRAASSDTGNSFTVRMTGLATETTYHVRAYVQTQKGETFYGNDLQFQTTHEITQPTLSGTQVSEVGVSKVTLSSSVTGNGRGTISDAGFVYSLNAAPTIDDSRVSCGKVNGTFGKTVTGLKEKTTYHVRSYAVNEAGTAYGAEATFTTLEVSAPTVSTTTVIDVSRTSATFTAQVTATGNGTLTDAGFVYSTNHYPTTSDNKLSCGKSTTLSSKATGLQQETTYYVRAYAINERGASYGAEQSFTTTRNEVNPYTTLTVETNYGSTTLDMATVNGGTFMMGAQSKVSTQDNYDKNAYDDERPVHQVTVSGFLMSKTLVTQYLWYVVMGSYPNISSQYGLGEDYPVYNVSYQQCLQFMQKLGSITGKKFRMPTEAEWEFAARGGNNAESTTYSGSNTAGTVAWYSQNAGGKTHPVAQKQANELNIYDMSGNLWEWCSDWYALYSSATQNNPTGPSTGSSRVIRGGGWNDSATDCRVSVRSSAAPSQGFTTVGLRLIME